MADKDVELTEPAAGPAGDAQDTQPPADQAQDAQPPADQAQDAQASAGDAQDAQPLVGKAQDAQPVADDAQDAQPPAGKAQDAQPVADDAQDAQPSVGKARDARPPAGAEPAVGQPVGGRPAWRLAAALGVVTAVLAGFGLWATVHANSLRANAAAQNTALTDGPATAAVRRDISAAVNTIFSYSYAHTAATKQAAQSLLTGPAVRQYNTLFALVTKNAPAQKLVVTTRVTNIGVELLTGNRARLLVFANQQDTRAGTGQTSYAGAMFAVTALRQGGKWKIENIDTFGG